MAKMPGHGGGEATSGGGPPTTPKRQQQISSIQRLAHPPQARESAYRPTCSGNCGKTSQLVRNELVAADRRRSEAFDPNQFIN
jgi:hypothetical protein